MSDIRDQIRKNRTYEVNASLEDMTSMLRAEGLEIEFGNIGQKTTYALVHNEDHSIEYVGYTFIKNMRYYNENTGKLRALQQAIARKETLNNEE